MAAVALVMAGGAAFAYWTFGGAGTGSATTAANPASGIVVSQTALTGLAPGGEVSLSGSLTNPNTTDVKVGTLTATITSVSGGADVTDFAITGNNVLVDAVVKKGAPLAWSGMKLTYANSAVNQDNGKNVTVAIDYKLSAFQENVLPALGTFRVLTVNGVKTFDIYVHTVITSGYVIQPGDTLSTYDTNATYGTPAWADNLATADASGNIRYSAPVPTPGHVYQITVKHNGSLNSFSSHLS